MGEIGMILNRMNMVWHRFQSDPIIVRNLSEIFVLQMFRTYRCIFLSNENCRVFCPLTHRSMIKVSQ